MALTERERGYGPPIGAMLVDRVIGALSVNRRVVTGQARIIWPCGRSHTVEASLVHCRSALSSWGDGWFLGDAEVGFQALRSPVWLTLAFTSGPTFETETYSAKANEGRCRCHFEVKS